MLCVDPRRPELLIVWLRVRFAEGVCCVGGAGAAFTVEASYDLRFVPRLLPLTCPFPFPFVTTLFVPFAAAAAAAAAPARSASSRFVSSWWACERRKRPLAAVLAALVADER